MPAAEIGTIAPGQAASSPTDLVDYARSLIPLLDASSDAHERARELCPEVLAALHARDMFRLLLPRGIGGGDISLLDFSRICEALAIGDPSTAWCINQGNVSALTASTYIAPAVATELFGDRYAALAWGARHGKTHAIKVPGGYRVSGSWDFASGSRHATLLGAHLPVAEADGTPAKDATGRGYDVTVLFPKEAARIIGDWNSMGLRGTGSDTYELRDLFVPTSHACVRDRFELRQDLRPITAVTSHLCYAIGFSSTALGTAQGMLNRYVGLARGKQARAGAQPMAENDAVQREIGELTATLRAMRAYLHATIREVIAETEANDGLSMDTRMALRLATTHVMRQVTEVSVACYRGAGTTAVLEANPFERRFRDALCISQHLQATPWHLEMVGRHLLGVEQKPNFV
jgi:indole-3-acetate monooxygenase